jgi:hypothetical protein
MEPMELRTYTHLWHVERRLYKLYDFTLPMPVSVRQLGIVIGSGVPWFILMKILHVPFAPPFGHMIWLAPPAILAWYANKPVAEGKRLFELLRSRVRFLGQARRYARLSPTSAKPVTVHARVHVWRSTTAPQEPSHEPPQGAPDGRGVTYHHA